MAETNARLSLLLRNAASLCALPLVSVVETLRPLPLATLPDAPAFVAGLAIVRGEPVAIVSLRELLGNAPETASRFVMLRLGARRVGLAVDKVIGIRALDLRLLGTFPSLLSTPAAAIEALGTLDGELLVVLDAGRLVPDEVFTLADAYRIAS